MAQSPFLDLYPTSKISGNKLSEEEIEYYKQQADIKRRICKEPGCGTPLASDNATGKCSIHGGSQYTFSRTTRFHKGWIGAFFEACKQLRAADVELTKRNIETLLNKSVSKWLEKLRKDGYISYGGKSVFYELTSKELSSEEKDEVKEVVKAVEEFSAENGRSACMTEVHRQSGLTVTNTKTYLKLAVSAGYLKTKEPLKGITLTEKGEEFLAKIQ